MLKKYQWKLRKKQNSRLYDLINVRSQLEKYDNNLENKKISIYDLNKIKKILKRRGIVYENIIS